MEGRACGHMVPMTISPIAFPPSPYEAVLYGRSGLVLRSYGALALISPIARVSSKRSAGGAAYVRAVSVPDEFGDGTPS